MKKIKLITKLTSLTLIGASCSSLIVINTSCSKNEPSSLEIMKNYFNTHKSILPNPGTTN
jgi:hypothetical protein